MCFVENLQALLIMAKLDYKAIHEDLAFKSTEDETLTHFGI